MHTPAYPQGQKGTAARDGETGFEYSGSVRLREETMKKVVIVLLLLCIIGSCVSASIQTGGLKAANEKHCQLCKKNSLWEYYQQFDSVGIINLSCGQIMDVAILNYEDDGTLLDNSGYTTTIHYSDGEGRQCRLVTTGSLGVCHINLSWDETSSVTLEELSGRYCQGCMEKIRMLDEAWANGQTEDKGCPFALADFATGKLYSVDGTVTACSVRDYIVNLKCREHKIEGMISIPRLPPGSTSMAPPVNRARNLSL